MPRTSLLLRAIMSAGAVTFYAACGPAAIEPSHLVERARVAMGSELHLTVCTSNERAAVAAFNDVFTEFDRLESLMSVWRDGAEKGRDMVA